MKRVFAAIVVALGALVLAPGVSHASSSDDVGVQGGCVGNVCGSVMNESNYRIWAIRNWGDPASKWRELAPGAETPRNEDWDGFYVSCNASGRTATWTFPGVWVWRDFTLKAGYMMKISTNIDAHVRKQTC